MENVKMISDVLFMAEQWDFEKNHVDITQIPANERDMLFHWKCPNCRYEWEASPRARLRAQGNCPCCVSNKAISKGFNDVLSVVHGLTDMYDFKRNAGFDIYSEGVSSTKSVHWKCDECGRHWEALICSMVVKEGTNYRAAKCPHYNTSKRKPDDVQTVSERPDLMRFWDYDKNTLNPLILRTNSIETALWKCQKCGHEWAAKVLYRTDSTGKCPCCELNMVIKRGINDFFTLIPSGIRSYDFEKNADYDIYHKGIRDKAYLWWKCEYCGCNWQATIASRVLKKHNRYSLRACPNGCMNHGEDSLIVPQCRHPRSVPVSSIPKLIKFWDYEKNTSLGFDPDIVSSQSDDYAWWKCKNCHYEWQARIRSRRNTSEKCPCCERNFVIKKGVNDVLFWVPELARIYDFEKNTDIDIYSEGVGSTKKAYFKCPSCGNEWVSSIAGRIKKGDGKYRLVGCPACEKRSFRKISYSEEFPELALMFNEKLNGKTLAYVRGQNASNVKYWWDCPVCGMSFESRVSSMITSQNVESKGCPYCSGRKLLRERSFAAVRPDLMVEYSPENTIDAYEVFVSCKDSVKWVCKKDASHVWYASFYSRHVDNNSCPFCRRNLVITDGSSFADMYKEYVHMWSPNNKRQPNEVSFDVSSWFKWVCPTCKGEFWAKINDITSNKDCCPYCKNRKVHPNITSLAAVNPEIAALLSPNNYFSADGIFPSSPRDALWNCPTCTGEFVARVVDMVSGEASCPYCVGRKPLAKFNTLAALYSDIAELLCTDSDFSADEVLPNSLKMGKWNCPVCGG